MYCPQRLCDFGVGSIELPETSKALSTIYITLAHCGRFRAFQMQTCQQTCTGIVALPLDGDRYSTKNKHITSGPQTPKKPKPQQPPPSIQQQSKALP